MKKRFRYLILAFDLSWMLIAMVAAMVFRLGSEGLFLAGKSQLEAYGPVLAVSLVLWTVMFLNHQLDGFNRGWYFPALVSSLIVASFYLFGALFLLTWLPPVSVSRAVLIYFTILMLLGALIIRRTAWQLVKSSLRAGRARRVVIIGQDRLATELAYKISKHPELMIEVVGFLSPAGRGTSSSSRGSAPATGLSKMRTLEALNLLQEKSVQEVIIVGKLTPNSEVDRFLAACQLGGMRVHFVPHWFELYMSTARLTEIDDVPLVSLEARSVSIGARALKRTLDIVGGSVLLVLCFPLMLLIWMVMRGVKGTPLSPSVRCGLDAKEFLLYRFNIDRWSPDLVGFEKLLAQLSLTELPQLWNVIRGEMSLVGPRPEPPDRVRHYTIWQRQRLRVRPGLTGLAQVNGLREHHSSEEKAHFDLQYIYRYSIFLDLSILLETGWTVFYRLMDENFPRVHRLPKSMSGRLMPMQEVLHVDRAQSR